jgi:uroporphyrinogen III methyltransferase/synthase
VLPVYRTVRTDPPEHVLARVRRAQVDAITFTSSSTVDNLSDLLGAVPDPQPLAVSIGPVTSAAAARRGWRVDAEAGEHTIAGVVATLVARLATGG